MVNPVKTPMAYIGNEGRNLGVGREQEHDGRAGKEQDPVGEDQPMATDGELPGQERVLGDEADEEGEPREAGVRRQNQDQRRRSLQRIEEGSASGARAVDELADLGDDRRGASCEGD